MSENLVEVKHLQQYFPAGGMGKNKQYVQAVDDVSFAIRKGETLGLVGESGCGKTTTGRTLLRLYEPTDGTIIYDGKVLFDKKEKIAVDMLPYRRRMQIVFQDPYASLDHELSSMRQRHDRHAPMPSLGSLATDAVKGMNTYPVLLIAPALMISIMILVFNLFGDGLRDAFDPKLKS